jgi:Protein of unknown function (DUF3631)
MSSSEDMSGADPELLPDVYNFTGRFIAYPSEHAHIAHVLWIVHTHLMDAWESTPRMAFLSPEPSSGKTRALLVPNPVEAVNVTPAYLFRKVGADEGKPTILYDEIDTVFGPKAKENEEIRGLLNAGHRRGAVAGRCVVHGKRVETEEISAYCAVALAGLGWLPDTILTRSVIIRMRRRAPSEKVTPFRRRVHAAAGHALRDRLAAWAAAAVDDMTAARPEMPSGIEDRDADVWEPLLAIADAMGWSEHAAQAAVALVGASRDAEPSLGLRLLADLRTVFSTSTLDALPTAVILQRLIELPESPWGDLRGKPITDRELSKRLRQYGIKSKDVRVKGRDTPLKGYSKEDLHDAWLRYLPPSDAAEARQARQARQTSESGQFSQENVADTANCERDKGDNERDSAPDVADAGRDSATKRDGNNSTESTPGADVADVADVRGNGGEEDSRICAQCNAGGEPLLELDGVLLHPECRRFWAGRDGLGISEFLERTREVPPDRRPGLGPPGDSLDDFK